MSDPTPRDLLHSFYMENDFGMDGGMSSSSVKILLTPKIHIYFPNFKARRKAVVKHDIHHLLTGYNTDLKGESEISAWEIGSGCKKYWAAFLLDTSGLMLGLLINFKGVSQAFSRGRKTHSLYGDFHSDEKVMDMKISDLQEKLLLNIIPKQVTPSLYDYFVLILFLVFGLFYTVVVLTFFPLLILYTFFVDGKKLVLKKS